MAIVASETRGNPWTPNTWVSMGFHILRKPMETYGHLYGIPWQLLHRKLKETHGHQTHGFPWIVETYGNLLTLVWNPWKLVHRWNPMETYGHLWEPMKTYGNFTTFPGVPLLVETSGNPW